MGRLSAASIIVCLSPAEDHEAPYGFEKLFGGGFLFYRLFLFCLLSQWLEDQVLQEFTLPRVCGERESRDFGTVSPSTSRNCRCCSLLTAWATDPCQRLHLPRCAWGGNFTGICQGAPIGPFSRHWARQRRMSFFPDGRLPPPRLPHQQTWLQCRRGRPPSLVAPIRARGLGPYWWCRR